MPTTTEVLIDSNILLRTQSDTSAALSEATTALVHLRQAGARLVTTVQNLAEFWNVSTRSADDNGQGLGIPETTIRLEYIEKHFLVLHEDVHSFVIWKRLVREYQIKGKQVHDVRLVAVMLANGIERILTYNTKHFARFPQIRTIHPNEVHVA